MFLELQEQSDVGAGGCNWVLSLRWQCVREPRSWCGTRNCEWCSGRLKLSVVFSNRQALGCPEVARDVADAVGAQLSTAGGGVLKVFRRLSGVGPASWMFKQDVIGKRGGSHAPEAGNCAKVAYPDTTT